MAMRRFLLNPDAFKKLVLRRRMSNWSNHKIGSSNWTPSFTKDSLRLKIKVALEQEDTCPQGYKRLQPVTSQQTNSRLFLLP